MRVRDEASVQLGPVSSLHQLSDISESRAISEGVPAGLDTKLDTKLVTASALPWAPVTLGRPDHGGWRWQAALATQ